MSKAKLLSDLLRAAVAERPITVGLSLEYAKEILELIDHLARIESAGGVEDIRERHSRWLEHFGAEYAQEIETRRDIATLLDVVARQTVDCQDAGGRIEELEMRCRYIAQERDAALDEIERLRKSEQFWLDERNRSERLYLEDGARLRKVTSERDEALRVVDVVRKMRARLAEIQEDTLLRDFLTAHTIIYPYVELLANMELPK